ncbi:hypothetical protein MNV49_002474 [Pseudohyphozyma bogoriensis]|nr:hypothetical protein MNV49_002474 [Pseudohyphozyma bogoriensis]
MSALLRETPFGNAINFLTRGRLLPYPEQRSGFEVPATFFEDIGVLESLPTAPGTPVEGSLEALHQAERKHQHSSRGVKSPIIVTWYSDEDPDNPQNWSKAKKGFVALIICMLEFGVYVGSSLIASGYPSMKEEFGIGDEEATVSLSIYVLAYGLGCLFLSPLSEIPAFGRNLFYWAPMVLPVLSTGGATLADMYEFAQVPTVFSIWVLWAFAGPAVGPVFGNFAAQAKGWRWTMYELLWISLLLVFLLLFFLPETSHDNILLRRAARLRALTRNPNFRSQGEMKHSHLKLSAVIQEAIFRPFTITVLDPSILFVNLYIGLVYSFYYLFFDSFPIVYTEIYPFNFGMQGVAYMSIFAGGTIGAGLYILYQQSYMNGFFYPKHGWPVNEKHLQPALLSAVISPIGLFIFAWTARANVHWIGTSIGVAAFTGSNFVTTQCFFFYILLSYPEYAASLLAANDAIRSAAAAGFLHAGAPMFKRMGIPGGVSFMAGVILTGIPASQVSLQLDVPGTSLLSYTGGPAINKTNDKSPQDKE